MKHRILSCLLLLAPAAFMSCDSEEPPTTDIRHEVLHEIGENVILPIYHDMDEKGNALLAAIRAFRANPSVATRDAARAAWITARSPFETAEAFEFGPIKEPPPGLKPLVDSWPITTTGENSIESYITDSSNFTKEKVANYPLDVRGFHAIEFILWGDADNGILPRMDANALHFLEAVTEVVVDGMSKIHDAWDAGGGNYIRELNEFGIDKGRVYNTVNDALLAVNRGAWHIAEELYDEYLADPINTTDPAKGPRSAESYFSDNSFADFHDIMVGVKAIYYGDWDGVDGKGLTDYFASRDAAFDAKVRTMLDELIAAVEALGPSFNSTVKNNTTLVVTAIAKAKVFYETLENEGVAIINAE